MFCHYTREVSITFLDVQLCQCFRICNILKRWKTRIYIALDENGETYISDYGLAQTGLVYDQSTNAACYTDPHNLDAIATTLSDAYGFGVLLLELMFGKRAPNSIKSGGASVSLVDYAISKLNCADRRDYLDTRAREPYDDEYWDSESWPSLHDKLLAAALKAVINNFQNQKKKQVETLAYVVTYKTKRGNWKENRQKLFDDDNAEINLRSSSRERMAIKDDRH
nr:hypothetical protein [Tanacetum cinerariifolium]